MDIVCPLPQSKLGNKYILVMCDYVTRYSWSSSDEVGGGREYVAEETICIFTRVGILQEILTNEGSNFIWNFLSELYHLLKSYPSEWTHTTQNEWSRKFNGTLKAVLQNDAPRAFATSSLSAFICVLKWSTEGTWQHA